MALAPPHLTPGPRRVSAPGERHMIPGRGPPGTAAHLPGHGGGPRPGPAGRRRGNVPARSAAGHARRAPIDFISVGQMNVDSRRHAGQLWRPSP